MPLRVDFSFRAGRTEFHIMLGGGGVSLVLEARLDACPAGLSDNWLCPGCNSTNRNVRSLPPHAGVPTHAIAALQRCLRREGRTVRGKH